MWTVLLVLGVLFLLLQIKNYLGANKTHEQSYRVIKQEKEFEIRFYPAVIMATVVSQTKSYNKLGNQGFRKLVAYVFGSNATKQHIAMTKPVHMDINDTSSTMSFVMPSMYNIENLPKPNNLDVVIKTSTSEYVAAVTFGGFASDNDIKTNAEKLETALKRHPIAYYGSCKFLSYNPPYQLWGRKNEMIVCIHWP